MKNLFLFTLFALITFGAMSQVKANHNTSRSNKAIGGKAEPNTNVDNLNNFDNTPLKITERAFFNVISSGYTISWTKSRQSNYTYSLRLIPVTTNEESKIMNLFINSEEGITEKNLKTNSYKINQRLEPNSYYALMVVKHPRGVSFSDFISTVDADSVQNYVTTWYYISNGEVDELPGAIDGCGNSVCGSDCSNGTCKDGSVRKCGCSGNSCFAHLCSSRQELTLLNL